MEELKIYRFQLEDIDNALRIASNLLECDKTTCLGRDVLQAREMVKNALNGEITKRTNRFGQ